MEGERELLQKMMKRVNKAVSFSYPGNEGRKPGILKERVIVRSRPGSTGVPYWDVVDLIEFEGEAEPWIRIGYYRTPGGRLIWGSQTTITEPITIWKRLLVQAASEKPWFMSLLRETVAELDKQTSTTEK